MPHPICGIEPGMVDGEKRGRVVQDEVLGPPGKSHWASETPYSKDPAIEAFKASREMPCRTL